MKWFTLTVALVCLFALQIVIEAKPLDDDDDDVMADIPDEPEDDDTPNINDDDTPNNDDDDTPNNDDDDGPSPFDADDDDNTPSNDDDDDDAGSSSGSSRRPSGPIKKDKPKKSWTDKIAGMSNNARVIMDTIKDGIETADQVLDFYDRLKDRVIPWKEFNETLVELDKFRKDYSIESATLIGDVKTLMMNGMDEYFAASQAVYEWAGLVTPLLTVYIKLFDDHTEQKQQTQRTLLLKVLGEGVDAMNAAQKQLLKSSASFNEAGGKLEALQIRFDAEFDEKSEFVQSKILQVKIGAYTGGALFGIPGVLIAHFFVVGKFVPELLKKLEGIEKFYNNLKEKVDSSSKNIDKTKAALKTEIQHIVDLKVQTEATRSYIDLDSIAKMKDDIIESVMKLIKSCKDYRDRHNSKTDLI